MKSYNKSFIFIVTLIVIAPQIALASWWNPLSWFNGWTFHKTETVQTIQPVNQKISEENNDLKKEQSKPIATPAIKKNPTSTTKEVPKVVQTPVNIPITSDEQSWINKGWVTLGEVQAINSNSMSPTQYTQVLIKIRDGYKKEYPPLIQKNILLDYLYHPPISNDAMAKLPPDIQHIVNTNDKNVIELQIKLLNDQIANYNFTMDQKFQIIINNYLTEQGLPATQPVPVKTNCTTYNGGTNTTVNCYTQ